MPTKHITSPRRDRASEVGVVRSYRQAFRGGEGVAQDAGIANDSGRRPDRLAAGLAAGFIVLLLATELVLSLPDETATPSSVATFYVHHRAFIIVLQFLGFVAAVLFGGYAWRLRSIDRVVSWAGLITALCALVPGSVTLMIAVV